MTEPLDLAEVQAEALKTGDWKLFNKLTARRANEAHPTEIDDGKALFLPEFQRLEARLQKKLFDSKLTIEERLATREKLTALSLKWTESGISDISVVVGIRDNIVRILQVAGSMNLPPEDVAAIFSEPIESLRKLNAIIAEANAKGIKTALPEVD